MRMSFLKSLAACAAALTLGAAAAQANDAVTFSIDWLPAGDKAVAYYGVQKGFFKEAGLDVSIVVGRGSSDVVTKLGTGAVEFGTGGLSALMQAVAGEGVPVKALVPIYTKQPDSIFTAEGSGITSLKDLPGKKIATGTFSSSNVSWPLVLESNGVDPASVTLLKVDPGALAPMLATGQVDGTIGWITVAPGFVAPLKEAGKTLKVIPWSEYGYAGYGSTLYTSDKMLAEKPEVVSRFVAAYQKATEAAIADPAGAAAALKVMVPEVDVVVAQAQWEASIPLMVNEVSKADGFGKFNDTLLNSTWSWVSKAQNFPIDKIDPKALIATGF